MRHSSQSREIERLQHRIHGLVIVIYLLVVFLSLALLCIANLMPFVQ